MNNSRLQGQASLRKVHTKHLSAVMNSDGRFIVVAEDIASDRKCAVYVNGANNTIVHPVLGTAPRSAAGFLQLTLVMPTPASISSSNCSIAQLQAPSRKKNQKRQRTKTNPTAGPVTAKPAHNAERTAQVCTICKLQDPYPAIVSKTNKHFA